MICKAGALALAGLLAAGPVAAACEITVSALQFAPYSPSAPALGQAQLSLHCDSETPVQIGADAGLHGAGDIHARALDRAGARLDYQLYVDAARTTLLGDGIAGALASGSSEAPVVLFARIPAGQQQPPGDYSDLIQISIDF